MTFQNILDLTPFRQVLRNFVLSFISTLLLGACASPEMPVQHGFEFDARYDSPDVQILAYRYGDSKVNGTYYPVYKEEFGVPAGYTNMSAPMPKGDSLYVKWRVKKTQEIFEQTVDLKGLLPKDIAWGTVYFQVKNTQLYIYFIPAKRELTAQQDVPIERYPLYKVVRLYPKVSSLSSDSGERQ